jgi:DNA-binding NtrC family response regulator
MKTTHDLSAAVDAANVQSRHLLVSSEQGMRVHALPDSGEIVVGRDPACDVVVDHPKMSRRHARIRVGASCTYADLGSRNGTVFRGRRLEPNQDVAMPTGESFTVGAVALLLLPAGAPVVAGGKAASLHVEDPAVAAPTPLLQAIARSPMSVLIRGETGAGKEILARALHRWSGVKGPMLAVNCAAVAETLLESELFGHERGAFTGAIAAKPGLLETAASGTVFLDEIGEMSPAVQAKLLRATEAREIIRVGGVKSIAIDVRFLAATHRDLLASPGFRKDLYYRLAGMTLVIPPLRERRPRIPALAVELLGGRAALAPDATARLGTHDWPGNVRELRNVLERALLLAQGGAIRAEHVVFDAPDALATGPSAPSETAERARILDALEQCSGNQTRAAKLLGVSRATLVNKLALLRIPRPRKK